MNFSDELLAIKEKVLRESRQYFDVIDKTSEFNTHKVLSVMRELMVSDIHFNTTSGYAYDDIGRQKIDALYAKIFGGEQALVRTQFVSGTHALASVLFGILRPGDELVSVTGKPYDTMQTVIGYERESPGSLKEFGVSYEEVPLRAGRVDIDSVKRKISRRTKMAMIQRSCGYGTRVPLGSDDIRTICEIIKSQNPSCICFVDNCYGEFVDTVEPTQLGADIIAGSLIKNPGGGLVPSGGYVVGDADLVKMVSYRLTAPGIGSELGASLYNNRELFQGIFIAPHVVAQALKGAIFAAGLFQSLGYTVHPLPEESRNDIIQVIELGTPEKLSAFCRGLQRYSPVDSFASPEAWDMPGYDDKVIMAAGTFVQGASIELSADGPMRPPYAVYLQGGLTFEHAVVGVMGAAEEVISSCRP